LFAARQKYSDPEFSRWFYASPYAAVVRNPTTRAALINIGRHEAIAEAFIRTTHLVSPGSIWKAIKPIIAATAKPRGISIREFARRSECDAKQMRLGNFQIEMKGGNEAGEA
jgi:hypothetical protein